MDLFSPQYSLLAILAALLLGFIAGRLTASLSHSPRQEARKHPKLDDGFAAQENLARLPEAVRARMETLIADDKMIEAIRDCRLELGLGLKEAKDVVDLMRDRTSRGARAP